MRGLTSGRGDTVACGGRESQYLGGNIMAKKTKQRKAGKDVEFLENLRWYMTTCYVLWIAGEMSQKKLLELTHLAEQLGGKHNEMFDWKEIVRQDFGVDDDFVKAVYDLCSRRRGAPQAVGFILRGLGCPDADGMINTVRNG